MIDKGTHLMILMWLHVDYTCCLAGSVNPVLGALSLFGAFREDCYTVMCGIGPCFPLAKLPGASFAVRDTFLI